MEEHSLRMLLKVLVLYRLCVSITFYSSCLTIFQVWKYDIQEISLLKDQHVIGMLYMLNLARVRNSVNIRSVLGSSISSKLFFLDVQKGLTLIYLVLLQELGKLCQTNFIYTGQLYQFQIVVLDLRRPIRANLYLSSIAAGKRYIKSYLQTITLSILHGQLYQFYGVLFKIDALSFQCYCRREDKLNYKFMLGSMPYHLVHLKCSP